MPIFSVATRTTPSAQVARRIAISVAAMTVQYWIAPVAHSWRPILAFSFLFLLVSRRGDTHPALAPLPPLSTWALTAFIGMHFVLLALALRFGRDLAIAAEGSALAASVLVASKLVVLVPILALFPARRSRSILLPLAPELAAATIALLTFDPDKLFKLIWPVYSPAIAGAMSFLVRPFMSGTHLVPGLDHVLVVGPARDMVLDISCSGLKGLVLFQILFAIILAVEWKDIRKLRSLVIYAAGCLLLLISNVLRLAIVFLTSNLTSDMVNPNWPLFILTLLALTWFTYDWVRAPRPAEGEVPRLAT